MLCRSCSVIRAQYACSCTGLSSPSLWADSSSSQEVRACALGEATLLTACVFTGNSYQISNLTDIDAVLCFFQSREIIVDSGETDEVEDEEGAEA